MRLIFLFAYTCCLALTLPLFFPSFRLFYFAPFLILSLYRLSLPTSLWCAIGCGLIIDLLSSQTRFGMYAVNYCLTVLCLYRYKYQFFEDRPSTLPVMTICFACLSALIQGTLLTVTGNPFSLSWEWISSNLFLMPLWDAFYALIFFTLPTSLLNHPRLRSYLIRLRRGRSR